MTPTLPEAEDLSILEGFALALFPRHPNLGLPLWFPRNTLQLKHRIGDVGLMLGDGTFLLIGNPTDRVEDEDKDEDDPEFVPMDISADDIVKSTHRFKPGDLKGFYKAQTPSETTDYTALLEMDANSDITTNTLTGECQFRLLINTLKNHNNCFDWASKNADACKKEKDLFVVCGRATAKTQVGKLVIWRSGHYEGNRRRSGANEEITTLFLTGLKLGRRIDRPSANSLLELPHDNAHDYRMLRDPLDTILTLILEAEPLATTAVVTHAYLAGVEEDLVSANKEKGSLKDALTSKMPEIVCLETGDSYWGTIALFEGQWKAFGSPSLGKVQEALRNDL